MAQGNGNTSRREGLDPLAKVEAALGAGLSNLWGMLLSEGGGGRCGLSLTCRDSRDWVAVFRASGEDGGPIVAFGNGESPVGALAKLNGAIAKNDWRLDKYAAAKGAAVLAAVQEQGRLPGMD